MNSQSIEKLTDEIAQMSWSIRILQAKLSNKKIELLTIMHSQGIKKVSGDKGRAFLNQKAKYNKFLSKEFLNQNSEYINNWLNKGVIKPILKYEIDHTELDRMSKEDQADLQRFVVPSKLACYVSIYLNGVMSDTAMKVEKEVEERNDNIQKLIRNETTENSGVRSDFDINISSSKDDKNFYHQYQEKTDEAIFT